MSDTARSSSPHHTKPVAPPAGLLDIPTAFLSKGNILHLLGCSDTTLGVRIRQGDFPPPSLIDGLRPRWLVSVYLDWVNGAISRAVAERRAAVAQELASAPPHARRDLEREARHLYAQQRRIGRAAKRRMSVISTSERGADHA